MPARHDDVEPNFREPPELNNRAMSPVHNEQKFDANTELSQTLTFEVKISEKRGTQSPDSAVHNSENEDRQGSSSSQSVSSNGDFNQTNPGRVSQYDAGDGYTDGDDGLHSDFIDDCDDSDDDTSHRCMWRGRENDAPSSLAVSVRQLVRIEKNYEIGLSDKKENIN